VWTLRNPNEWSLEQVRGAMEGARSERVDLARPVSVTVLYITAVVSREGVVSFYDDVYSHDARLERVLAKGYPFPAVSPGRRETGDGNGGWVLGGRAGRWGGACSS
jgi:hypothetical protein